MKEMLALKGQVLEERYLIRRKLGGGAFGTVFAASELFEDGTPVREVALKLYPLAKTREGRVDGMLRDCAFPAKILSSDAPEDVKRHFVPIYGWGRMDTPVGRCAYVSMELLDRAQTLENIMENNERVGFTPDAEYVLGMMRQFFAGLAAAHTAGVLHRDIKGANVMIRDSVVKIVDFGMGADASMPDAQLMTTMSIYAPENFSGRHSTQSDLYQAGLMFYRLWTGIDAYGHMPGFYPDTPEGASAQHAAAERMRVMFRYKPGGEIDGVQPSELLDAVLRRCLEFNEGARFSSAREVIELLSHPAVSEKETLFEKMTQSFERESYGECISYCEALLKETGISAETKAITLETLGDCRAEGGDMAAALESYLAAFREAKEMGVYFARIPDHNRLVNKAAGAYEAQGKAGMARIFKQHLR